jgi:hypothetical protein
MRQKLMRVPTLESLFVATFALLGFGMGARPIGDNSTFVHLRTGIDMARGGGIPRIDAYSFTAAGEPWVVQSWLAELSYGALYRLGGMELVVLQQGVLVGALGWLVALLARAGTPLRTAAAASAVIAIGVRYWAPRPLLFGLLGLAVLVLVVERRASPWWLIPVAWIWVNTHGSFALGLLWLALRAAGEWLDSGVVRGRKPAPNHSRVGVLPYAGVFVLGVGLGGLNPLGPRLLAFVATVTEKRAVLAEILEWRSPSFTGAVALVSLGGLLVTLGMVAYRRAGWADVVPLMGFVAAGLVAQRNLAAASVVAAPVLARALHRTAEETPARPRIHLAFVAVLVGAAAVFPLSAVEEGGLDTKAYPVAATEWLEDEGLRGPGARLAHQDFVGGWLILRDGRDARVFIDDRVDMYPAEVVDDYIRLLRGRPGSRQVLERRDVDAVLWERDRPLSTILAADAAWRRVYRDDDWVVFVRAARAGR